VIIRVNSWLLLAKTKENIGVKNQRLPEKVTLHIATFGYICRLLITWPGSDPAGQTIEAPGVTCGLWLVACQLSYALASGHQTHLVYGLVFGASGYFAPIKAI